MCKLKCSVLAKPNECSKGYLLFWLPAVLGIYCFNSIKVLLMTAYTLTMQFIHGKDIVLSSR